MVAAEIMIEAGFKDVKSITGGMDFWHRKGYPTLKTQENKTVSSNVNADPTEGERPHSKSDIYTDQIMFYWKHPKNKGKINRPTFESSENIPLCGDKLTLQVLLDSRDRVQDIRWDGQGCAISQASASILTQMVKQENKTVDELRKMSKEEFLEHLGINSSPNRLKCALLSYSTLKSGVITFVNNRGSDLVASGD